MSFPSTILSPSPITHADYLTLARILCRNEVELALGALGH